MSGIIEKKVFTNARHFAIIIVDMCGLVKILTGPSAGYRKKHDLHLGSGISKETQRTG